MTSLVITSSTWDQIFWKISAKISPQQGFSSIPLGLGVKWVEKLTREQNPSSAQDILNNTTPKEI